MFNKSKQVVLFFASLVLSVSLLSTTNVFSHSLTVTTPGNVCQPANLAQALARGMSWNQFRVYNPSETQNFFVTCGVSRSPGDNAANIGAYVVAHFADGHDINNDVSCIWRSIDGFVDDSNIGTTVLSITKNIDRVNPTPTTAFDNTFGLASTFPETSLDRFWTVTCNLPAKTGINSIGVYFLTNSPPA